MTKNNEYIQISIDDCEVHIKINGIEDEIFSSFIEHCKDFLLNIFNKKIDSSVFFSDIEKQSYFILKCYNEDGSSKTKINYIDSVGCVSLLKQEVGYEIINKLKEIFKNDIL